VIDVLRIDNAAITQQDALLPFVEAYVFPLFHSSAGGKVMIQEPIDPPPSQDVLLDNGFGILGLGVRVKRLIWIDDQNRPLRTEAETTRAPDLYLSVEVMRI
jgi:hypothetical protein